ncbi:MAG: EamA family transporter RarD [Actinobacteria bacterium]|nr:EamA family transporter RarD [Actinomycetota bacterium]MBI3685941.1 EamA family transporter RarD [Actinomycetota bacterium]
MTDRRHGQPTNHQQGLLFGLGAYGIWGAFPLYWPLLRPAGAVEILAHRVVWTLAVVLVLVAAGRHRRGRLRALWGRPRALATLGGGAVLIAINWGTYIWGVNHGQVVETSLGYFINPLVTVLLGVVILDERLRPVQWLAIGIGAAACVVLTVDYGRPPYLAFVLAGSFGLYGLAKKSAGAGAVDSLAVETAVLAVPALVYLGILESGGQLAFGHVSPANTVLLALAGPVTAVPLLLFSAAVGRLALTTLGLLQYVTPVLQFGVGVLVVHETMPPARWLGFSFVWLALTILSVSGMKRARRMRMPAVTEAAG